MRVGSGAGGTQVREPYDPPGCLLRTSLQKPFCSCTLSHSPHQSPLHCLKHLLCAGAEPTAQCGTSEALEVCPHHCTSWEGIACQALFPGLCRWQFTEILQRAWYPPVGTLQTRH